MNKDTDKTSRIIIINNRKSWPWYALYIITTCLQASIEVENDKSKGIEKVREAYKKGDFFRIVFVDVESPPGPRILEQIKKYSPNSYIVATSEVNDWRIARASFRLGASDFIMESNNSESLLESLDKWRSKMGINHSECGYTNCKTGEELTNDKTNNIMHR